MRVSVPPERLSGPSGPNGPRAAREPRSRDMRALHGGSEHNAATGGRRQLEEEGDLDEDERRGEPDSEDKGVMGGEGVRGQLDLSSQVSLDLSQSQDA